MLLRLVKTVGIVFTFAWLFGVMIWCAFGVGAVLVVWGAAIAAIFVAFQTWVLRVAGEAAMPASAIYVAIFNAAIGSGALVGSAIYSRSGLSTVMWVSAAASGLTLLLMLKLRRGQVNASA
ncbi:MAG: hypothetical protein HC793_01770 [Aquincola sp.]|nr:hypothetical protein [Aquincola sp.]